MLRSVPSTRAWVIHSLVWMSRLSTKFVLATRRLWNGRRPSLTGAAGSIRFVESISSESGVTSSNVSLPILTPLSSRPQERKNDRLGEHGQDRLHRPLRTEDRSRDRVARKLPRADDRRRGHRGYSTSPRGWDQVHRHRAALWPRTRRAAGG